jgi:hypothetical protein
MKILDFWAGLSLCFLFFAICSFIAAEIPLPLYLAYTALEAKKLFGELFTVSSAGYFIVWICLKQSHETEQSDD